MTDYQKGVRAAKFDAAIAKVRRYHELHKQPCWMVPVDTGYRVVKLKPRADQLPSGTRAIQYGPGLVELASVEAKT